MQYENEVLQLSVCISLRQYQSIFWSDAKNLPLPSTPPPSQGTLADDCLAWQSQAAPEIGQGMGGAEPAEEEGVPEG